MNQSRLYLLFSAAGLLPIALSYGVAPAKILPQLVQINAISGDLTHIFRAIMGLYLALIVLWLIGAWRGGELMYAAILSEIVFMLGLAAGRILSLFVDGRPSPILMAYAVAEFLLAAWGISCLRSIKFSRVS
jgi:hypothetical protein